MVIDQQEKIRDGGVQETWTLFSYARPKGALTYHQPIAGGGTAYGSRAPSGAAPPGLSFPAQYIPADANGGLCIGRNCTDALGAWGPSATNKLHRVYTGALLAITIGVQKQGLNVTSIGAILCS